ncbi:MAG: peptidyl-prolyl cis-trans isomerase [Pirellulales bacterium]|nr:peptidyl-prolyl cis-trans isomerase [Pirellulales bacterium]
MHAWIGLLSLAILCALPMPESDANDRADASNLGTPPAPPTIKPIEGGQIIARVGGEVILASELLGNINRFLAQNADQIPPSQLDSVRRDLMQRLLTNRPTKDAFNLIEVKLLYGEVCKVAPPENLEKIRDRIAESFDANILPNLMEAYGATHREELEAEMKKYGSSIDEQRRSFIERQLALSWIGERIDRDPEITHVRMLAYYQEHLADYEHPAQVKWQELMVRFDHFDGDRDAAYRAIAEMGNAAWHHAHGQAGMSWEELAKTKSHGFTALEGGIHDWTTRGSLVAEQIDAALFSLPIGTMSEILEGPDGWHIVRVLDRKEAGRTSFADAQMEIRKKLREEIVSRNIEEYLGKLRRQTKVWTIFSGEMTAEELIAIADQATLR